MVLTDWQVEYWEKSEKKHIYTIKDQEGKMVLHGGAISKKYAFDSIAKFFKRKGKE